MYTLVQFIELHHCICIDALIYYPSCFVYFQLAIEGTTSQPLPSPKATSTCAYGHDTNPSTSPTAHSIYQTLQYNYGEPPVSADHRQVHACMRVSTQQHQHSTGNVLVRSPQTNPISIPTSVTPMQHQQVIVHSPTTASVGVCPNCSLGFQQATSPTAIHLHRRPSSEEPNLAVPGVCYYNIPESGKKKYQNYQNVAGPPYQ